MSLGGLDMPPQYEHTWGAGVQLPLPSAEDCNSLDVFSIFDELKLNFDDSFPLFDGLLQDCEPTESQSGNHQVRHDCMWAGTCVEDKERPSVLDRLQEAVPRPAEPAARDTRQDVLPPVSVPPLSSRAPSVKCNQRSLLRTNHNLPSSVSDQLRTALPPEDSDDSGRPETPQSMSSDTDISDFRVADFKQVPDFKVADFKQVADFKHSDVDLGSSFHDEEETDEEEEDEDEEDDEEDAPSPAVPVSDVTGQTVRTSLHLKQYESAEGLHRGHVSRHQQSMASHFFNDHSYHLSKSDVSASIPGNLTPSDSEDEIDVVSVCGEKSSSSRSSSQGGVLPANPSARDRHALQQTMASAMKYTPYPAYLSGRQPSGKLARMQAERQRERKRRRAQDCVDSSEEDAVRAPTKKRAKLSAYKQSINKAKRGGHSSFKMSSSDSEPDSCEKRSLHNNMERQRRVDLRNAFEDLRVVVPTLSPNPRAAKVVILKEASHFCHQLTADCKSLQQESTILERERDRLLARVSFLRKQMASIRMAM